MQTITKPGPRRTRVPGNADTIDYAHPTTAGEHTQSYLWGPIVDVLGSEDKKKVFDLGCGNGAFARHLIGKSYDVFGIDPSVQGIEQARKVDPKTNLETGNAYEPLAERFGQFPVVVSLEVVGHLYDPRKYARCVADLLEPGGIAVISTPYHNYLKNLLMASTGRMKAHLDPLWDHGVIKFWSVDTLTSLFAEVGLQQEQVLRVGRIPILAKSMILVFRKAEGEVE